MQSITSLNSFLISWHRTRHCGCIRLLHVCPSSWWTVYTTVSSSWVVIDAFVRADAVLSIAVTSLEDLWVKLYESPFNVIDVFDRRHRKIVLVSSQWHTSPWRLSDQNWCDFLEEPAHDPPGKVILHSDVSQNLLPSSKEDAPAPMSLRAFTIRLFVTTQRTGGSKTFVMTSFSFIMPSFSFFLDIRQEDFGTTTRMHWIIAIMRSIR